MSLFDISPFFTTIIVIILVVVVIFYFNIFKLLLSQSTTFTCLLNIYMACSASCSQATLPPKVAALHRHL